MRFLRKKRLTLWGLSLITPATLRNRDCPSDRWGLPKAQDCPRRDQRIAANLTGKCGKCEFLAVRIARRNVKNLAPGLSERPAWNEHEGRIPVSIGLLTFFSWKFAEPDYWVSDGFPRRATVGNSLAWSKLNGRRRNERFASKTGHRGSEGILFGRFGHSLSCVLFFPTAPAMC